MRNQIVILFLIAFLMLGLAHALAQTTQDAPNLGNPKAIVDLSTHEGVRLVNGEWRYSDAKIIEVDHKMVGPDLKPSGAPSRTNDITPHAGAADFDDAKWEVVDPATLDERRSGGKLSFNWYRINVTLPEFVGTFKAAGSAVVFEIVVDDYAEVWVDGKLPTVLGQTGGQLVKGFNAPNRVLLTRDARPGQKFQLAIFGANGPLSNPPGNFIWVRSATLDFYEQRPLGEEVATTIVRRDPSLDRIIPPDAKIIRLAGGFQFTEGPVWHPDGYLLFSDPNANTIYRWSPADDGAAIGSFAVEDVGQPGNVEAPLDPCGDEVAVPEDDPVGEVEAGDGLFSEGAGGGEVIDHGLQPRVVAAEVDCIGAGAASKVQ